MNELQIFDSEEVGEIRVVTINEKTEYIVNGKILDRFKLLACAAESDSKEEAWKLLNLASRIFHPLDDKCFNTLYGTVAMETTRRFCKNEFYYQELFKKNYSKIRKGKVVNKKSNGHDIPDAWVARENEKIPVEVKLNNFDKKALNQLKRYMKNYGCRKGIAVGRTLTIELPMEIEFVSLSELEYANG